MSQSAQEKASELFSCIRTIKSQIDIALKRPLKLDDWAAGGRRPLTLPNKNTGKKLVYLVFATSTISQSTHFAGFFPPGLSLHLSLWNRAALSPLAGYTMISRKPRPRGVADLACTVDSM